MSEKVLLDSNSIRPNSHKSKQEKVTEQERQPRTPIVAKDAVVRSKKPLGKKISQKMDLADGREVRDYIVDEKIIPGLKDFALDMLEMIFYGERSPKRNRKRRRDYDDEPSWKHDYRSDYGRSSRDHRRRRDYDRRRRYDRDDDIDYQNIVLRKRVDAERIVDEMRDRIVEDGSVSVAVLYELVGIASEHTDNKWGWTRSSEICITRVEDGYLIDVDQAKFLD